jgi:excisionase family DNA binding protein
MATQPVASKNASFDPTAKSYLTIKEVARLFRVSNRTVVRWTRAGHIHPVKIGHIIRFERQKLLWDVEKVQARPTPQREDPALG